jgi:hypothetical protein
MNLTLQRDSDDGARTFGALSWSDDQVELITLERPWVPAEDGSPGGHPMTSCVPPGVYRLVLHDTAKHPQTWALVNESLGVFHEPGDAPAGFIGTPRFACLIHSANLVHQLEGCIGVGLSRGTWPDSGEPDITSSVAAFARLKAAVAWTDGHTLTISGP